MNEEKIIKKRSVLSYISMILGATAILPIYGIFAGTLATLFGIAGLIDISKHNKTGKIEACIGIVLGAGFAFYWLYILRTPLSLF